MPPGCCQSSDPDHPITTTPPECDVLVVGSGNAGFSAALSASQFGAKTAVLIDKCAEEWVGGNLCFTAGAYRVPHDGLKDVLPFVCNVSEEQPAKIQLAPYTDDYFLKDIRRVCEDKSDPALFNALCAGVERGSQGACCYPSARQEYVVDGKINF